MFVLNSDISIGDFVSVKPHDVRIEKSAFSYVDRATIKIPLRAKLDSEDLLTSKVIKTSEVFKEGMKVVLNLGYNGVLKKEFEGFVSRVNFASPLELECEGFSYQLRKKSYLKTFKNTTLREVLKFLINGTDIILDSYVHHVPMVKFVLSGESGTEALEKLKKELLNTICIRFINNVLLAEMFPIKEPRGVVKYKIGWNVIQADDLKKRDAKNDNFIVHIEAQAKDGTLIRSSKGALKEKVTKITGNAGIRGEVRRFKSAVVHDKTTLDEMSASKHDTLTFDGFEGKIKTFLVPYCETGWKVVVEDEEYPERNGAYIIQSVAVSYGMTGARRDVEIGMKLS